MPAEFVSAYMAIAVLMPYALHAGAFFDSCKSSCAGPGAAAPATVCQPIKGQQLRLQELLQLQCSPAHFFCAREELSADCQVVIAAAAAAILCQCAGLLLACGVAGIRFCISMARVQGLRVRAARVTGDAA